MGLSPLRRLLLLILLAWHITMLLVCKSKSHHSVDRIENAKTGFRWFPKIIQTGWKKRVTSFLHAGSFKTFNECGNVPYNLFLINHWFRFSFKTERTTNVFITWHVDLYFSTDLSLERQLQAPLDGPNYSICRLFLVLPGWNTVTFTAFGNWALPAVQCSKMLFFFLSFCFNLWEF